MVEDCGRRSLVACSQSLISFIPLLVAVLPIPRIFTKPAVLGWSLEPTASSTKELAKERQAAIAKGATKTSKNPRFQHVQKPRNSFKKTFEKSIKIQLSTVSRGRPSQCPVPSLPALPTRLLFWGRPHESEEVLAQMAWNDNGIFGYSNGIFILVQTNWIKLEYMIGILVNKTNCWYTMGTNQLEWDRTWWDINGILLAIMFPIMGLWILGKKMATLEY